MLHRTDPQRQAQAEAGACAPGSAPRHAAPGGEPRREPQWSPAQADAQALLWRLTHPPSADDLGGPPVLDAAPVADPVAAPALGAAPALPGAPAAGTALAAAPQNAALRLLQFEAAIRRLPTETELQVHLVNRVQQIVDCDRIVLCRWSRARRRWQVVRLTALPDAEPELPWVDAWQRRLAQWQRLRRLQQPLDLDLALSPPGVHRDDALDARLGGQGARHGRWQPLADRRGRVEAGVLFLRGRAWSAGECAVLGRLAETYAHAWLALPARRGLGLGGLYSGRRALLLLLLLGVIGALPVRQSVMAPVEVVAAEPRVITAPISGIVRQILVAPNQTVRAGDLLVQFDDIQPRNESVLAQQRMAVAQARYDKLKAQSFTDPLAGHELASARAEYELALVNHEYALEVLRRTQVRATRDGVALYAERRDAEGRAVQVGEELLQVADPGRVAYRIALAAGNLLPLGAGAEASIHLDQSPLGGLPARVREIAYLPRAQPDGSAAYAVRADPVAAGGPHAAVARIGARGTARLYGEPAPLAWQVLRRPWGALRQSLGW